MANVIMFGKRFGKVQRWTFLPVLMLCMYRTCKEAGSRGMGGAQLLSRLICLQPLSGFSVSLVSSTSRGWTMSKTFPLFSVKFLRKTSKLGSRKNHLGSIFSVRIHNSLLPNRVYTLLRKRIQDLSYKGLGLIVIQGLWLVPLDKFF